MTLRGVGFVLVLCGSGCAAGAATETAKGKSVNVRIEAEDRHVDRFSLEIGRAHV